MKVAGIVWYSAPFSTDFKGRVPSGEVFILGEEPDLDGGGVVLLPERYEHFEQQFIDEKTREIPVYSHYSLFYTWRELRNKFEVIEAS